VEVLRRISKTLDEKGGDALSRHDVKRASLKRVFGFELLPAPYVVAHLQLGLLLQDMGAPLNIDDAGVRERVAVYLTNALTGWEPNLEPPKKLFPELDQERDAAGKVKQQVPILVILGNPPYNAFAGVAPKEEQGLVNVYKEDLQSEWNIKKFNLDDLYIRFFRLAERRIAEKTGRGIVCFISSSSYMDDASYVVMRKRLLNGFDVIQIDNMNGDSRETGKLTPDGQPDPSVFSTEHNKEGIRVGTAISLLVRKKEGGTTTTYYRDFWGITKRQDIWESLEHPRKFEYKRSKPERGNRFSFKPMDISEHYQSWPRIIDICAATPIPGLQEMRRSAMIDTDKNALVNRMQLYFSKEISWTELCKDNYGFCVDGGRFDASACRGKVLSKEHFDEKNIKKYSLFPLEKKWAYIAETRPLWNEPRPELSKSFDDDSTYIITRYRAERPHEYIPIIMIKGCLPDYHLLRPNVVAIPLKLKKKLDLFETQPEKIDNLSPFAVAYLASINVTASDQLWYHVLATGFSTSYLTDNKAAILSDWPRIPLPPTKESLEASATLGYRIAALLDVDTPVPCVNEGQLNPIFRFVGRISTISTDISLEPEKGHLELTAGWGHAGKDGVTMPGKGKIVEREYTSEELEAINQGAQSLGLTLEEALNLIGTTTCDIYLNDIALWRNVPKRVWEYYIGGYQVIKKWLSYRESALLGRSLTPDEARYVTDVVRRLMALRLMEKELDANYHAIIK
jgi:predicted helicase